MTELIKQRLVGLLIVVIAGVIFIPDLLDGQKGMVKEEFKKTLPKPVVKKQSVATNFPKQQVIETIAQASNISQEQADDESNVPALITRTKINDTQVDSSNTLVAGETQKNTNSQQQIKTQESLTPTTVTEKSINQSLEVEKTIIHKSPEFEKSAWVLRLGTFRNKPNVDALLTKLESAGVRTFVKPVEAKAGLLYRVFVGPELEKTKLESAQKTLKKLTGLNGKITQFQPVN